MRRDILVIGTLILLASGFVLFLELRSVLLGWDFYTLYGLVISVLLSLFIIRRFSVTKCLLYLCFLFFLIILKCVPWTSRKAFVADLYSLRRGMHISEVEQRMSRYLRGTGLPLLPSHLSASTNLTDLSSSHRYQLTGGETGSLELKNSLVYRHSDEGHFNGDWGIVKIHNGHVMSVSFSMD